MYTNQTRMTGLSGLDTESMIRQLMEAESMKLVKVRKSKQLNVWKQEQFRDIAKTLQTFQDSFLTFGKANNLKSSSSFSNMTTLIKLAGTETASTALSVTTSEATKAASYKLRVDQTATQDVWRGSNAIGGKIRGTDAVDYSGIKEGDSFNIALDGRNAVQISFDASDVAAITDAQSFTDVMNDKLETAFGTENVGGSRVNKVSASIDASGQLSIQAGAGHTAVVSGERRTANSVAASGAAQTGTDRVIQFDVAINGVTTGIDVNIGAADDVDAIAAAINTKLTDEGITGVAARVRNGELSFVNSDKDEAVEISGADLTSLGFSDTTLSLENASVFSDLGVTSGASTSLNMKGTLQKVFGVSGSVSFEINGESFNMDSTYTIERMMNTVNNSDAGVKMSYDSLKGTFSIESEEVGGKAAIQFSDTDGFLMNDLGLVNDVSAKDAIITLNGVSTTRDSNEFTIEDMKISLTEEADGKEFNIQINKDTAKTTDLVKNFITEYNKLVDTVTGAYETRRPKSDKRSYYEPLTEEERKALSDSDLEKYEAKAKEGLLYRDSILQGIAGSMRSMLYEPLKLEDGSKITLYDIGITTAKDYRENGKLEIDEEKFAAALSERGDEIIDLFTQASDITYSDRAHRSERMSTQGIAYRLEDIIRDAIGSNGSIANRAGIEKTTSVSENKLSRDIMDQDQRISDLLKMLAKKEEYYYRMFGKLEAAMNQANSQMASLQSLMG